MDFGFSLPNNQGALRVRELAELAQGAEAAGCRSVWVSEHLFHTTYVAERLGTAPYHEPLTVLAAAALRTSMVELGTSVLILPWHHPVALAKRIASLDDLSQGRVVLGVGVAIARDEYAALGVDFESRGRRADESLQVLRALWEQPAPAFAGEFFSFDGLGFWPKPWQQPFPIVIGGNSKAALRRIARHGNGWHALSRSPREMADGIQTIRDLCSAEGRDATDLTFGVRLPTTFVGKSFERPVEERRTLKGTPDEIRSMIMAYEEAGVDEIIIDPASRDPDAPAAMLEQLAREGILP